MMLRRVCWGLEKANIPPIFKKGKMEDPRVSRLISLTSALQEVMEQIILKLFLCISRSWFCVFNIGNRIILPDKPDSLQQKTLFIWWVMEEKLILWILILARLSMLSQHLHWNTDGCVDQMSGQWCGLNTTWTSGFKGLWSKSWSQAGGQTLLWYFRNENLIQYSLTS